MSRRIALLGAALAFVASLTGCGEDRLLPASSTQLAQPQTCIANARPDTVRAASFNFSIGFKVEDLLFLDLSQDSIVNARAESLLVQSARSLPRERIREAARTIAQLRPDVVGLQEALHLERNGVVQIDMLDTLAADLKGLGLGDWKIQRRAMNAADLVTRNKNGDTLHVGFHEGLALLVSPRWQILSETLFPYRNVLSISILGRRATSERAAQTALLRDSSGFELEVWNTHLEVLSAQRQGQAGELVFLSDSLRFVRQQAGRPASGRLLLGDLNAEPHVGADSMVRAAQWQDLWDVGNGPLPGNTCCVTKLRDTTTGYVATGRRIDRVMHQGVCRADSAQVLLNAPFVTSEGIALFPSDHGMVYGRLIYGVRP